MILRSFKVGEIKTNCYLLMDKRTKKAVVIDPGAHSEELIAEIKELGAEVKHIIITHGHWDHIGGVNVLKEFTDAEVLAHTKAKNFLTDERLNFSHLYHKKHVTVYPDRYLEENMAIHIGDLKLSVIHTPGHTPGCICLYEHNKKILFSGDLLFKSTVGRSDLPGGDFHTLISSLRNKILPLSDVIEVYPGHGVKTTLGHERYTNNFLK